MCFTEVLIVSREKCLTVKRVFKVGLSVSPEDSLQAVPALNRLINRCSLNAGGKICLSQGLLKVVAAAELRKLSTDEINVNSQE